MTNTAPAFSSLFNVPCPVCGDNTRLYGIEPHIRLPRTEIHTYVCDLCDVTEAIVKPIARAADEVRAAAPAQ